MIKKDIMLVAGYPYLTESTFQSLQNILGDRVYIYDPYDYNLSRDFKDYTYPSSFNRSIVNCSFNPFWKRYRNTPWLVSIFIHGKKWTKSVINDVHRLNPKTIILITDIFPSSRTIENSFHEEKNILLIQPCLIDAWEREDKYKFKRALLNFILKLNFFHTQQYWGLESSKNKLCLYDHELSAFFKSRRGNIEFIESPMKKYYANTTLQNRVYKDAGKKLKVGIFPVDYSSVHGTEYQKVLEKKYHDLCNSLSNEDIFVKVHPHEEIEYWKQRLPKGIKIIKDAEKNTLYSKIDVHISTYSYSSIEAFYCGAYAINFEPNKIAKQGNLEDIFINNSSLYSEDFSHILEGISTYKVKNKEEKMLFIKSGLENKNYMTFKSIKELV
jgi:hypothetical protein